MFKVEAIEASDWAVCTNYVTEEYRRLMGEVTDAIVGKVYTSIKYSKGFKVVDSVGTIVAFTCFEWYGPQLHLVSYFINPSYRCTAVLYLISNTIADGIQKATKVTYLPLVHSMPLPTSVCSGGVIDKDRYRQKLDMLRKRWGTYGK